MKKIVKEDDYINWSKLIIEFDLLKHRSQRQKIKTFRK